LTLLSGVALIGLSSAAQAETWVCSLFGATQKVILTQESDPALSDDRYVPGTVTGPYGKKYTAEVSIDGFDRRWDYVTADKTGIYAVFMGPSGLAGFYDFSNPEEVGTREPEHVLFCKGSKAEEKNEEDEQGQLNSPRERYILAIRQKIERNWINPLGNEKKPCEIQVTQGPGGIILDVQIGTCGSDNETYRKSIVNAVYKSDPLPNPEDPELFDRELFILFNPEY
jgi:hypothetical protein